MHDSRSRTLRGSIIGIKGQRHNLLNNNVTVAFNPTFVPNTRWQSPTTYINPRVFRLNAEFVW